MLPKERELWVVNNNNDKEIIRTVLICKKTKET